MRRDLGCEELMAGPRTHIIQLTREEKGRKLDLPGMVSRRTQTAVAMRRKRREGWLQRWPLSYDQARCIDPRFAECYAVQVFSIISDFDPKLMSTEKNPITMRKVCSVIQFLLLRLPDHQPQLGSRETPHISHLNTESQNYPRRNQRTNCLGLMWVVHSPTWLQNGRNLSLL